METNRLRQFCLIFETGSLTRASELLHVTHSSLSKSMKVLQDEVGHPLLQPNGRGIAVTEDGKKFYILAKDLLQAEGRLLEKKHFDGESTLRIGSVEIFLSGLTHAFKTQPFENRRLSLLDLEPGTIERTIAEGNLDFGITYAPYPTELVETSELGRFRLSCFCLEGAFKGADFQSLPFVVPAHGLSNNPLGIKERDGWIDTLYTRNKVYSTNLLSTALELVMQGLCAVYIPVFLAQYMNQIHKVRLVEWDPPKEMEKNFHTAYVLRSRNRPEDREFKRLCSIVRKMIHL